MDKIIINFHVRKNSKCALERHQAQIFANHGYLCPVANILEALRYLRITPDSFLFHAQGDKENQMKPASLVTSIKRLQKVAGSNPQLTVTDIRSSAISALSMAAINPKLIEVWAGRFTQIIILGTQPLQIFSRMEVLSN